MKSTTVNAYDGLDDFSSKHKLLIRTYLIYLMLIPGVSMLAYDITFDIANGKSYLVFLILIFMHLMLAINNFKVPSTPLLTFVHIIRIPAEILILSIWQDWSIGMALSSLYAFEILGMSLGLTIGTIFRKAEVPLAQRLISMVLAIVFSITTYFRFEGMFIEFIDSYPSIWISIGLLMIPVATATLPYAKMFISGQDDKGLNMGTSKLTQKLGPYMGLAMLLNLILMIIGINW